MDVPGLDHAMHLALERLLAAWQPLRALHVSELLSQITEATEAHPPGDATWVGQLALPPLDPARLVAAVELSIDDGRSTGLAEARAQSPRLAAGAERMPRPDRAARLYAYGEGAERLLAAGLVQSASREAFRLTATTGEVDIPGHVETILGETPMLAERDVLAGMGTGAVNEGRYEVAEAIMGEQTSQLEAAAGDTQHAVYALEILDGNTCENCAAIDGQEYATLAEARADYPGVGGGYVDCLGRERCRGSLVIVYDEAAPTPEPPGPLLPPPLPRPRPPQPPTLPVQPPEPTNVDVGASTAAVPAEVLRRMFASSALERLRARVVASSERFGSFDTRIKARITNADGTQDLGVMLRHVRAEQRLVEHDGFILDDSIQGKGVGKDMLASSVREYDKLGIERVTVRAGDRAGRYTWAKFGFDFASDKALGEYTIRFMGNLASRVVAAGIEIDPTNGAVLGLAQALPETVKMIVAARRPSDFADLLITERGLRITGKELMLSGPEWNGVLTLDRASESRKIFDAYTAGH